MSMYSTSNRDQTGQDLPAKPKIQLDITLESETQSRLRGREIAHPSSIPRLWLSADPVSHNGLAAM